MRAGYVYVWAPDGYVREHVAIAEAALGKPLPAGAVVHHVNGVKHDNRPTNLVVCEDNAYHSLLHMRGRAMKACGDPSWRMCKMCRSYDAPENLTIDRWAAFHKECDAKRAREYRKRLRVRVSEASDSRA